MAEIRFHQVNADGSPGTLLGTANLHDGIVTCTPGVAQDTVAMLGRRFGRRDAEIFDLIRARGWSNGSVVAIAE
ncbi:hypothetical protein ACWEJ6_21030 [Nonomuraea sp. NPDC004702]